jgi:hypothetical protein
LYADALINRPAAGFVGRIFIDTDNPSTGIYRDTGTSWINVAGGGIVGTQNLQQVCNVGFVTTTSMGIGTSPGAFAKLQVESNDTFTSFPNAISNTLGITKNQNLNAGSVIANGPAYVAASFATNYNIVNNINIPNGVGNFGATYALNGFVLNGQTVNQFQAAGIRAISEVKSMKAFFGGAGSGGTLTHSAGLWSYGLYSIGANPTVQNHYGVLISNQTEVFAGTVTNRYGLYQEGTQDWNFFASKVTTDVGGSPGFGAQQFRCIGNAEIQSFLQIVGAGTTSTTFGLNVLNNGGLTGLRVLDNGNVGIRVSAPTARLHIATGGATTASLGLKVRNSADTIDILSTFGTSQVIINSTSGSLETSAQLQIDTTTRGFLPPRMTRAQVLAIVNPAPGLMAYATDVEHLCYYNPTSGWQKVSSANL